MADSKKQNENGIQSDIPQSFFEEALKAVENIEKDKKKATPKSAKDDLNLDIFNADSNAQDLDELLSLLEQEESELPTKAAPKQKFINSVKTEVLDEDEDDELANLLNLLQEDADKEEIKVPVKKKSVFHKPVDKKPELSKEDQAYIEKLLNQKSAEPTVEGLKSHARSSVAPSQQNEAFAQKEEEIKELNERIMRLQAEFENYRKRSRKENEEAKNFHNEKLILGLLPIVDNFERAIEHMAESPDQEAMQQGVDLIYKQIIGFLESHGLRALDTKDSKFNPTYHEALATFRDPSVPVGTIISEYESGFLLNGRLLRPSKVLVAIGTQNGDNGAPEKRDEKEDLVLDNAVNADEQNIDISGINKIGNSNDSDSVNDLDDE